MIKYNVLTNDAGDKVIERVNENGTLTYIPSDLGNSDYQRYLAWLENPEAEQSTPILSDEAQTK